MEEAGQVVQKKRKILGGFLEHVTTVTHVLLLGLTIHVIWLCASKESTLSLIADHVVFCIVGWTFFMNESVLCMTEYNIFTKYASPAVKVKAHVGCLIIGFGLGLAGFLTLVAEDVVEGRPVFVSAHGIIGLIAVIFGVVNCVTSVTACYHDKFEKYANINSNYSRFFHVCVGLLTFVLGAAATITGFYTPWFKNTVDRNSTTIELCLVITVLTTVWTLWRPLLSNYKLIKRIIS